MFEEGSLQGRKRTENKKKGQHGLKCCMMNGLQVENFEVKGQEVTAVQNISNSSQNSRTWICCHVVCWL